MSIEIMLAGVGAVIAVIVAAFLRGSQAGTDAAKAGAAASHQKAEERGNEAATDAQRTGVADRLRGGQF